MISRRWRRSCGASGCIFRHYCLAIGAGSSRLPQSADKTAFVLFAFCRLARKASTLLGTGYVSHMIQPHGPGRTNGQDPPT
jgi:hypothetical protein